MLDPCDAVRAQYCLGRGCKSCPSWIPARLCRLCCLPDTSRPAAQLQAQLALGRRKLTLWSSPVATLRHFSANASATFVRGVLWLAQHPLTLFMGLPFVAAWLFLKHTGARPQT